MLTETTTALNHTGTPSIHRQKIQHLYPTTREQLKLLTSNIKQILKAGGFLMKPWVYSDQSGRKGQRSEKMESKTMILPNQLTEEDNKALGLSYTIEDDKLHVMVAVNFSKKRRKMHLGQDLLREVRRQTPDPLTKPSLWSL